MPTDNVTTSPSPADGRTTFEDAPLAIQVEDLHKSFSIPTHRVDSLKERFTRPFAAKDFRELRALDGVSFDVRQGEFFGIVGRNGSGKSTLLKLLASIYRADAGTIRMAGRLAPFIELGVGFNVELTARENVVLNGVMMGLTPKETRDRLDTVIEFAELGEFVDLKLKNYSSGMLVRLAFSVMMQADADILLIDEVLAVGDASFQQKCDDAFHEMKAKGKTIVLVTHDMNTVEEYCNRAMLIDGGKIRQIGDPAAVGRRYLKLNFERGSDTADGSVSTDADAVRILDAHAENPAGATATTFEHGEPIRLRLKLDVLEDLPGISAGFIIANADGVGVSQFDAFLKADEYYNPMPLRRGQRVEINCELKNPLTAGRYHVHLGINQAQTPRVLLYVANAIDFVVYGGEMARGVVAIEHTVETAVEGP
ncbi:MAG TPA: ABC transporter ATP-binding protein [Solirubrobacterales bacterium]|jgi:ABC-type polysaccharide/polyol phosphate transport system ATPase subunit|nr:ABC transporter ATP-binding protein [Solirubrobacterales bacterium]